MPDNSHISGTENNFLKGMNKDMTPYLLSSSNWINAKNVITNSQVGDEMILSTESANGLCVNLPYPMIGSIALDGDQFMVFCTDNTNSEIGIVDTSTCTYTSFSRSPCLNFNQGNLITGAARRNYDCGFNVYWSDGGRNPDRYVNTNTTDVNNNIWIQNCTTTAGCVTCVNTNILNCDNIRIAPLMSVPCVSLNQANSGGNLLNGTYQIAIAYAVNGIKVTDYVVISNAQTVFNHNNQASSITLNVSNADTVHFTEMQVTVISMISGALTAKILGIFSTRETTIYVSSIDLTLPNEDISIIPLQRTPIESSDSIWSVNDYLLRSGVYEIPDFNYQPIANNIVTKWVLASYEEKYYKLGGNSYSYMQDEQYCFFIRWVYNDGARSSSYHIPGRAYNPGTDAAWATQNTAQVTSFGGGTTPDGLGTIVMSGLMGYWQSTELYPDNKVSVWGSLCGQPIRHHKFPDPTVNPQFSHFNPGGVSTSIGSLNSATIGVLGVEFSNIGIPLDNNGTAITNIVGYEILRGSREGNKSIVAKGMLNNMANYTPSANGDPVLFQNYPYNDLSTDNYLTTDNLQVVTGGADGSNKFPVTGQFNNNFASFHSPDTTFQNPALGGAAQLKLYQDISGQSVGYFESPYKHPKFKVPTNFDSVLSGILSAIVALGDVASAFGGLDFELAPTPDLPFTSPLGLNVSLPEGTDGALAEVLYVTQIVYNLTVTALILPIQYQVIYQQLMNIINGVIPARQYALQYDSHGWYGAYTNRSKGTAPTANINDYEYIKGQVQTFAGILVNNLYRNDYLALQLPINVAPIFAQDNSRFTGGQVGFFQDKNNSKSPSYIRNIASSYGGIKVPLPAQYGQVQSPREILITSCVYPVTPSSPLLTYSTPVLFGGDTYINRYTEKNPFLFFSDWLINEPDDIHYNYRDYINVPYPAFWIDNTKLYQEIAGIADYYRRIEGHGTNWFYVNHGQFYLFCNGVRDFYVESEVNVGYRDWDDELEKRFYDPYAYTNLAYIFRSDFLKYPVYYKYDYSLSISKFYTQYISFGSMQDETYDPLLAYTCYDYMPRRVAYSLPQTEELKVDNWRQFLPNNFYDFYTPVRAIKSISKTGALFMLDTQSPVEFTGVQVLNQEIGKVAITIGDGGLFNQALQNVVNAEKGLNYGSSKSRYSAINTPYGLFWVSQENGKIFNYTGHIDEISNSGMRQWFTKYLPSKLLTLFPTVDPSILDNPLIGVGVQCSYDEANSILYISKKDYELIPFNGNATTCEVVYNGGWFNECILSTGGLGTTLKLSPITLGDPNYFSNISWTISYDCKNKLWLSFHSWFPDLSLSARNHNFTTKTKGLWQHNKRVDKFSNYYGIDYPTSIEMVINTPPDKINTLKNIEYYLDTYQYNTANMWDRRLMYDVNWDNIIIRNDEQISGLLHLNKKPQNPYDEIRNFPNILSSSIEITYSLRERLYRVNQFWDVIADRGEYTPGPTTMIITNDNGVDWTINPVALNLNKDPLQRKKFRGEFVKVLFQKNICGSNRLQFYLAKNLVQNSPR